MKNIYSTLRAGILSVAAIWFASAAANAGPIFITGHDPDFHAQSDPDAVVLLETGLNFATSGTFNTPGNRFLWVESNLPVTGGHLFGEDALTGALGLVAGVNFDHVDAAGFATVDLSNYTAIAIASSFGGMLTQAEIDALIARESDIATFINAGGGLFASSECGSGFSNCDSSNITDNSSLFGFLPGVSATSVSTVPPYTITPFGTTIGAPFGLTSADLQDPTHNSFAFISGLTAVDLDAQGQPTTLAGNVHVGRTGFDVPEPGALTLVMAALLSLTGFGLIRRAGRV